MERHRCEFENCNRVFSRRWNLNRHIADFHGENKFSENCILCNEYFTESKKLQEHLLLKHRPSDKFLLHSEAFERSVSKYRMNYGPEMLSFRDAQNSIFEEIKATILYESVQNTLVKVSLVMICQMSMHDYVGDTVHTVLVPFRSSVFTSHSVKTRGFSAKVRHAFQQQEEAMEEFCKSGSNWVFDKAVAFDLEIAKMKPLVMGGWAKDMKVTKHSHLYDPENEDDFCFLKCLYKALSPSQNFLHWKKNLNTENIHFPITLKQVKKFLDKNPELGLKLNILYRDLSNAVFPIECGIGDGNDVVNLLMVDVVQYPDTCEEFRFKHFMLITDLDKFLQTRYRGGFYDTKGSPIKYSYAKKPNHCVHCFQNFSDKIVLEKHLRLCMINKPVVETVSPEEGIPDFFHNHQHKHPKDLVGYLDFETVMINGQKTCKDCLSLRCKCDKSFTEIVSVQEPCAYCLVFVKNGKELVYVKTYIGNDAADHFVTDLITCWNTWIVKLLFTKKEMVFSRHDKNSYEKSQMCWMCERNFESFQLVKCRDHDHLTGQYLGASCQSCNLKRTFQRHVPIFLHNGSKFDFHFIVRALAKKQQIDTIKVLPHNTEHFRTIQIKGFKFLDSLAFLQSSLAQLTKDLSDTQHSYRLLKQSKLVKTNGKFDSEKFQLLLKKSFYPYEFCTSVEKMKNTTKIPRRSDFYSSLSEQMISEDDYAIAKKVWNIYGCVNLLDYAAIYCKLDTILLAEVFEKFRNDMLGFSELDPTYYISLPGFAYDSMLKITKCQIELLADIDMVHFFELSIRGGVSFINHRYLKAEEDGCGEIVYIDANVSFLFDVDDDKMLMIIKNNFFCLESIWFGTNIEVTLQRISLAL